jgi:hypothetical protein
MELAKSNSHDWHGTPLHSLPNILKDNKLRVGSSGVDYHGKGVYFGHGAPANGFEPNSVSGQIALPTKKSNKVFLKAENDQYALSRKDIPIKQRLPGKSYVSMPIEEANSQIGKDIRKNAITTKSRVLFNNHVNEAFSKYKAGYDPWGVSKLTKEDYKNRHIAETIHRKSIEDYISKYGTKEDADKLRAAFNKNSLFV